MPEFITTLFTSEEYKPWVIGGAHHFGNGDHPCQIISQQISQAQNLLFPDLVKRL